MKFKYLSLLLLATLCLSSCYPEERFWWSPQGDRAVVVVANRLHLVTADGELGPPLMGGGTTEQVNTGAVSWLPDGSGFVCLRIRLVKTWAEVLPLIPAEEAKAVDQTVPLVLPLLEAATKLSGEEDALGQIMAFIPKGKTKAFAAAVQRKFQESPAGIEKLLLALPKGSELVEALKKAEAGFEINELCLIKLDAAKEAESVLVRSLLHGMMMPKVSPKHAAVAFFREEDDEKSTSLEVLSLKGGTGLKVASRVSAAFDWMPDGQSLVFLSPLDPEGTKLQSIHRLSVLLESGALMLPQSEKQADGSMLQVEGPGRLKNPITLAAALMLDRPSLHALPDGRILFASQPATLPAADTGAELDPRLYLIAADGKSLQTIATTPGDLPADLNSFVVSPDGKRIAVVENKTDAVAVIEVDTGKTQIISPPHPQWECRTLPAWKSATELTFAALHNGAPKWMLWSEGKELRSINEKWPADSTAEWLVHEKNE